MSKRSKKVQNKERSVRRVDGHNKPFDPLEEIEEEQGEEMSGKMHDLAEKPTKRRKRARDKKESYRPLHRR